MDFLLCSFQPLTQLSVSSHTFSPSLHPTTSPLVIQSSSHHSTYICLAPRNVGNVAEVHVWSQARNFSGDSLESQVDHQIVKLKNSVSDIHALLSGEVLLHHNDSTFSIIKTLEDGTLQAQSQSTSSPRARKWVHHIGVLDRFASATIMRLTSREVETALIVRLSSSSAQDTSSKNTRKSRKSAIDMIDEAEGNSFTAAPQMSRSTELNLELFHISEVAAKGVDRISLLSLVNVLPLLGLKDARQVKDVTLHHSGRLVVCSASGQLIITTLRMDSGGAVTLTPATSISIPLIAQPEASPFRIASVQLVTSSTALLVIGQSSSDTISALLVDLDLDCILSEASWSAKGVESTFVHRVAGSIAMIIATRQDSSSKIGATLWALPYEVNEENHLRWGLANSNLSRKWMAMEKGKQTYDEAESNRMQFLKEIERIAANKAGQEVGKAIDEAFDKWNKKETSRLETQWLVNVGKEAALDEEASSDSDGGKTHAKTRGGKEEHERQKTKYGKAPAPAYPQSFVSAIITFALPVPKHRDDSSETALYARRTVHHLLTSKAITHSSRPDLMSSLQAVNDWDATMKALHLVNDLPEYDIVKVLLQVIQEYKSNRFDANKLETFMRTFIALALDRSQLRIALKNQLEGVNDIISVLDVLCSWLDRTQETLLEEFRLPNTISINAKKHRKNKLPELDQILLLLCDLMDTYFPLFLATPSTHEHLQRLSKQINQQLIVYNQLLILCGPLAAFSRLQADQEKEGTLEATKNQVITPEEKLMNLKRASKKAIQSKHNAIGEVGGGLGKGILGEKSRRRQMYEESVAVGLYTLERLEL